MPSPTVVAVLDTSVLMRLRLLQFSLRIATAGGFQARWSDEIEDELRRKLVERRPEIADRVLQIVSTYPNAHVDVTEDDHNAAMPACLDPNDVHVLAAGLAVRKMMSPHGNDDYAFALITDNIKDFDVMLAGGLGIEVIEPDPFFMRLLDVRPEAFVRVVDREPPARFEHLLELMRGDQMTRTAQAIEHLFDELR